MVTQTARVNIFSKAIAWLVTLSMAVFMAGSGVTAALATTLTPSEDNPTVSLTVNGLRDGDTVNVYRVVETTYNSSTNTIHHAFAPAVETAARDTLGLTEADDLIKAYSKLAGEDEANAVEMRKLADALAAAAHAGMTPQTGKASGETAVVSGLEMGQYLISVVPNGTGTGLVYQNTLVSVQPGVDGLNYDLTDPDPVTLKSTPVSITKTINGEKSTDKYTVGEQVPFTITATIPSYPAKATCTTFRIIDKATAGLSINSDSAKVYIDNAGTKVELTKDTNYKTSVNGDEHVFDFDYNSAIGAFGFRDFAAQNVVIELTGTVTDAAVTTTEDINTAKVGFTNNPYDEKAYDEADDDVSVKVYGVYLMKVEEANLESPLEGAKFTVWKQVAEGEAAEKDLQVDLGTTVGVKSVGTFETGADGYGSFAGLGEGKYYVEETEAPDGYSIPGDGLVITADVAGSVVDTDGGFVGYLNLGVIENPLEDFGDDNPSSPGDGDDEPDADGDDEDDDDGDSGSTRNPTVRTGDIIAGTLIALGVLIVAFFAGSAALRKRKQL